MAVAALDEIQDTLTDGGRGTSFLCIQVSVKCVIGKVDASDVRRKLDAKCTTLFYLASMYFPTCRDMVTDFAAAWGQRTGPSAV